MWMILLFKILNFWECVLTLGIPRCHFLIPCHLVFSFVCPVGSLIFICPFVIVSIIVSFSHLSSLYLRIFNCVTLTSQPRAPYVYLYLHFYYFYCICNCICISNRLTLTSQPRAPSGSTACLSTRELTIMLSNPSACTWDKVSIFLQNIDKFVFSMLSNPSVCTWDIAVLYFSVLWMLNYRLHLLWHSWQFLTNWDT